MSKNTPITVNEIFDLLRSGQSHEGVERLYQYHYNKMYGIAFSIVKKESINITPFIADAEASEKRYASYNTRTGEVLYYDILPAESERTDDLSNEKSGSDRYYDPSEK